MHSQDKPMSAAVTEPATNVQATQQTIVRLIVAADSPAEAQPLIDAMRTAGFAVTAALVRSPVEFQAALKKQEWDIIFSPPKLAAFSAIQALHLLQHAKRDIPLIVFGERRQEAYIESLRAGAAAMVDKDHLEHLQIAAQRELRNLAERRARLHYEKMYRDTERRLMRLTESAEQPIAYVRKERLLYANPAFVKMFAAKGPGELASRTITDMAGHDEQGKLLTLLEGAMSGAALTSAIDTRLKRGNGTELSCNVEAVLGHVNGQRCVQIMITPRNPATMPAVTPESDPGASVILTLDAPPDSVILDLEAPPPPPPPTPAATRIASSLPPSAGQAPTAVRRPAEAVPAPVPAKPPPSPPAAPAAAPPAEPVWTLRPAPDADPETVRGFIAALTENRFRLAFQPIVNLHAEPAENYEVLVRMVSAEGVEIMPKDFMPSAEKAGFMPAIDRWVIDCAMGKLARHRATGREATFFIKLSEASVRDFTLAPWLGRQLVKHQLPGDSVVFEIRDADAMTHLEQVKQLTASLKQSRCRVMLDHFSADGDAITRLETLHADYVKFTNSFVNKIADPRNEEVAKAIIQTAHDLGTLTVAGFVQEASHLTSLWQCGVDYIQGYFLQQPDHTLSYDFSAGL